MCRHGKTIFLYAYASENVDFITENHLKSLPKPFVVPKHYTIDISIRLLKQHQKKKKKISFSLLIQISLINPEFPCIRRTVLPEVHNDGGNGAGGGAPVKGS